MRASGTGTIKTECATAIEMTIAPIVIEKTAGIVAITGATAGIVATVVTGTTTGSAYKTQTWEIREGEQEAESWLPSLVLSVFGIDERQIEQLRL